MIDLVAAESMLIFVIVPADQIIGSLMEQHAVRAQCVPAVCVKLFIRSVFAVLKRYLQIPADGIINQTDIIEQFRIITLYVFIDRVKVLYIGSEMGPGKPAQLVDQIFRIVGLHIPA